MAFLGLMTVKEHEAVVAKALDDAKQEREFANRLLGRNEVLHVEVATLLAELATLKSARERQLANLAKGSAASAAKRKAAAQS